MMSSQFSYELDERQIRLVMQDAELEYNEALWNKFNDLAVIESKSSQAIGNFVSSFNMSINRSVIVPVLFVVLIGGLSAMLFSFVDFKKKIAIDKEIPLVANPDFAKKTVKSPETIKAISKTQITTTPDTMRKATITPAVLPKTQATTLVGEKKKEDTIKLAEKKPKAESEIIKITKTEPALKSEKRKKTRKIKTEILPIINSTTNLNEGISEPELDLK